MWYAILIVLIAVLYSAVYMKETFILKYNDPRGDGDLDLITTDPDAIGTRLFATWPHTCPCHQPEYDAGLCYPGCDKGYHGVATGCWADSTYVGGPRAMEQMTCAESGYAGWNNIGLFCQKPMKWNSCKFKGLFGECWGGLEGGQWEWKKWKCNPDSEYPDQVGALCYPRCPPEMPHHMPAAPYACWAGGDRGINYDRGAGSIPPPFRFGGCPKSN